MIDTVAPTITTSGNKVAEATSAAGATVTYAACTATESAACSTDIASGSVFPIATTTVTASATDIAGNTRTATFTIKVQDTTAPTVTITSPVAGATYDVGNTFIFSYIRADAVGVTSAIASLDRTTTIANGATINTTGMLAGSHSISVVVGDAAGNATTRTVTFTIRVSTATLTSLVNALPRLTTAQRNLLTAPLTLAQAFLNARPPQPALARLALTAFIALVAYDRSAGLISAADAAALTAQATALRSSI